MHSNEDELVGLEQRYWILASQLDLFRYLTPLDITETKKRFLAGIRSGEVVNPSLHYPSPSYDFRTTIDMLSEMLGRFRSLTHPFAPFYVRLIQDDIEAVENIEHRSSGSFSSWLTALYDAPQTGCYDAALSRLQSLSEDVKSEDEGDLSASAVHDEVTKVLHNLGFSEWSVLMQNRSARISVDSVRAEISIHPGAVFDPQEVKRLLVHEIGTHVLRRENGRMQKAMLFAKGFPDYLETEEGLAIVAEESEGLLTNAAIRKYCCRLLATYMCGSSSFAEIFNTVRAYLAEGDAFDVALRVKRGLSDTSQSGGFRKDHVYFTGWQKIAGAAPVVRRRLFVGKIGLQHLDALDRVDVNWDVTYPEWTECKE